MNKGTVARKMDKGYGFISPDGEEKDLFFHMNELNGVNFDDLKEGTEVTFEVSDGPKGLSATNVSVAESGAEDMPMAA